MLIPARTSVPAPTPTTPQNLGKHIDSARAIDMPTANSNKGWHDFGDRRYLISCETRVHNMYLAEIADNTLARVIAANREAAL